MKAVHLSIILVAVVTLACNESAGPASGSDLEGTWEASAYVFTSVANPSESVDATTMGLTLSITFTENTFSGEITIPGDGTQSFSGTYALDGDQLTISEVGEPPETVEYDLSGNTLTLYGSDTFDFDDDGVEDDATTEATLVRQ